MKVTVVDYGTGNLFSVSRALETAGADVTIATGPTQIQNPDRLVVPGVGAFGNCASAFNQSGFKNAVLDFISSQRPFLGICVGMQMLLDSSEEFGTHPGLGVIPGTVTQIPNTSTDNTPLKRPHIGWAPLSTANKPWENTILANTSSDTRFYFVHSFQASPQDPNNLLATCDYGGHNITAAVQKDNVIGTQFHPEKSGPSGLTVLKTFLTL